MTRSSHSTLPAASRRAAVLAMLLAAAGVALAADVELTDQWHSKAAAPAELKRILVIGITRDAEARHKFEDRFVSLLRGRLSDGIPSYTIVPDLAESADKDKVIDALFSRQVDGVITVFLEPLDDRSQEAWAAGWRERVARETTVRAYVGESLKAVTKDVSWIGVEFGLWSVETRQRLWAGRTDGQHAGQLRKQVSNLVQAVINDLVYDQLLH